MASSGPLYPTVMTTQSVLPEDDNDWTNPGNIGADDNAEAQITAATYDANDISFRLKAQGFGFAIPAGATIDGILVDVAQRRFAGAAVDNRVQLLDEAGALVGDNKATATAWPGVETNVQYGGSADTWNWATVTPAKINDPDFGVVVSVKATAANTDIGVDYIRVTVYYTVPPQTHEGAAVMTGEASFAAAAALLLTGAAVMTGEATLVAAAGFLLAGEASMSGEASLAADGSVISGGDGYGRPLHMRMTRRVQ